MEWREVIEYPNYEANRAGLVRNKNTLLILKPQLKRGYQTVNLYREGKMKTKTIHRIIMSIFKRPDKRQVNHIDGDKTNNQLSNLEYCTAKENREHALVTGLRPRATNIKLTEKDVREIKIRLSYGVSHAIIAEDFGITRSTITDINNGRSWTHVTVS